MTGRILRLKIHLFFALVWQDRAERSYQSSFSNNLNSLLDSFPYAICWDINPENCIQIDANCPNMEAACVLMRRVAHYLELRAKAGTITYLGAFKSLEDADAAVAATTLAR